MKKKQIIYIVLTIVWMSIIFIFSNRDRVESTDNSQGFIYSVVSVYEKVFDQQIDKDYIANKLDHPIRKTAHYILYFVLGFLVYKVFFYSNINKKYLFTFLVCLLYSISDEIHQIFIPGRPGEIKDILIDCFGSFTVLLIIFIINGIKDKKMI